MKKILLIIAILLALGLAVKLVLKPKSANGPQQIPDQTSNGVDTSEWEIYRSEEFEYEMSFPLGSLKDASINGDRVILVLDSILIPSNENIDQQDLIWLDLQVNNSSTEYTNPCVWYFAERENINIMEWDPQVCEDGATTFAGQPAFMYAQDRDGTNGGLFAVKSNVIVFFYKGRPWEIRYSTPPSNPTSAWRAHPYYPYLEQSVPITEAIVESFGFVEQG
jgi:hypothetical protein